ncbi:MAG: hypothetical protein HQK96_19835, partial [Nitrospirae bacterium]|nr:hypothetical protein [Nitrospirota bacterium]
ADLVLPVFDATAPSGEADAGIMERLRGKRVIAVLNKMDLLPREVPQAPQQASLASEEADFHHWLASYGDPPCLVVDISAKTGEGLDRLRKVIYEAAMKGACDEKEGTIITNLRHKVAIDTAIAALEEAAALICGNSPLEITAIELRRALESLCEITGSTLANAADGSIAASVSTVTANDVLNRIFSEFCIGK